MMICVGISQAEKQRQEKVKLYQELNICQIEIETALWRQPSFCVIVKRVLERHIFRLDGADQSKCIYNLSSIPEIEILTVLTLKQKGEQLFARVKVYNYTDKGNQRIDGSDEYNCVWRENSG
jgi:hypothetical protein